MSDETFTWSVEVSGQLYEASLNELVQWIAEGALLPTDKVRRGNLRWIEAGKVPQLIPHFRTKASGNVQVSRVDALIKDEPSETVVPASTHRFSTKADHDRNSGSNCSRHPESAATVECEGCGASFCRSCPNTYGSVKICPECGSMCRPRSELERTSVWHDRLENDLAEGFGFRDFMRAISHPFSFKSSLFFGALMFAFFTFGRSASAMGGIVMFSASLTCTLMANMLTFGILANTVESFSQGKVRSNFMPDFDDFSLWDDVVHPCFLSIGVYISSFGLFILVVIFGLYLVATSMATKAETFKQDVQRIPGTRVYDTQRTVEQSQAVQEVLDKIKKQNEDRLRRQQEIANQVASAETGTETAETENPTQTSSSSVVSDANSNQGLSNGTTVRQDSEAAVMDANDMIHSQRKAQLESIAGKARAEGSSGTSETVRSFLTHGRTPGGSRGTHFAMGTLLFSRSVPACAHAITLSNNKPLGGNRHDPQTGL